MGNNGDPRRRKVGNYNGPETEKVGNYNDPETKKVGNNDDPVLGNNDDPNLILVGNCCGPRQLYHFHSDQVRDVAAHFI